MVPDFSSLTPIEARILRLIEERPAPGRHAARNALHCVVRAEAIAPYDPEMALLRAVTAEEEAARALFTALQRVRYPDASRLKSKWHKHKAAVAPFLAAVGRLIAKNPFPVPEIYLDDSSGSDVIRVRTIVPGTEAAPVYAMPKLPLNVVMQVDGRTPDLAEELAELLSETNLATVEDWIVTRARERESLLYATDHGIPYLGEGVEVELKHRRGNVLTCLSTYLLIDSYQEQQTFVLQCLPVFLRLLQQLDSRGRIDSAS